jgi:tetratricopeptide (TPR) repeat protein
VEADPGSTQAREEQADAALRLGTLYLKTGRQRDAREWLERAAGWFGQLAHTHPNDAGIALRWAESVGNLRMIASLDLSQFDHVLAALARVRKKGETPRIAAAEADVRSGRAAALDRLGRHEEAAAELKDLADQSDKRAGENRTLRGLQLLKAGKVDYALAELEAVVADPGSSGLAAYNAACVYALAAARDAAETRSSRAIELLKLAADRGFFQSDRTVRHVDRDPDLAILRGLPEYQNWRSSLPPVAPTPTP